MLIYHATHRDNLTSIGKHGVSTSWSQCKYAAVWGGRSGMEHWGVLHAHKRHGWPVEDIVVLEIETETVHPLAHGKGLYYSLDGFPPSSIRRVIGYDELSASPAEGGSQ